MIRASSIVLSILFIFGIYVGCSESKSEPHVVYNKEWAIDDSMNRFLDEFELKFEDGLNEKRIPGAAVAIVKDGRVVYEKGFGVREKGTSDKVDEHTVFRLGSVSKGFASILTGVFVEERLIDWDEPVSKYLEDFKLNDPEQTDRVQIRHLLSHTSGLPRHAYTNLVEDGLSLERIIPRFESVPLISEEGRLLSYQNAAYSVIEKVLESQTNRDFNSLLKNELFTPLNMNNASSSYDSIRFAANKAMPHIYYSRSRGRVSVPISRKYYNAVSSGGINASAADMGKWLLLLTGERPEVISNESLEEIYKPMASINNKRFSRYWDGVNSSQYGMGWRVLDNDGQRVVYHGGYVNGYRSEIAFDPDNDIGISILINTNSSYPLEVIPDLFNYFRSNSKSVMSN